MLVHRTVTHCSISLVAIYTPSRTETKWSKVPCLRKQRGGQGLNAGPPYLKLEVLTTRPHMPPQGLGFWQKLSQKAYFIFKMNGQASQF